MTPISILIADDHRVYREGMRAMLAPEDTLTIVGEAGNGEEVAERAVLLQPDVVLMDLKMPGLNGIEATRRILSERPQIRILVITMFDDDESVFAAMRAGARGYLLKDADQEEIVRAIHAVNGGEVIFGPAVASRVIGYFNGFAGQKSARPEAAGALAKLTDREHQILGFIAQGLTNGMIAARLSLSIKTVQNYVSNIFAKLEVEDRAQAMLRARDAGLGGR
jgi:DNA-binding NarL/FixJ family response regulator